MSRFPHFTQPDAKDCGPTCIKIIAKHFGKLLSIQELRTMSETTRNGSSILSLSDTAEKIGFRTLGVKLSAEALQEATLPCILYWNNVHFVVLYKIKKNQYYISDPERGLIKYNQKDFLRSWIGENATVKDEDGIALLIEPSPKFYQYKSLERDETMGFAYLSKYLLRYKIFIFQIILGLIAGSLLQLIVPFLTQSVVDVGIKNKDVNFIYLILVAQIALFIGQSTVEIIRSWILLHLSTRINISLISDFFIKLMSLPISYFDTRMTGDIMQRINDHQRVESILTTSSLNVLFSLINFIIFSLVLAHYSTMIFMIFLVGSFLYFFWIIMFLKRRRALDYIKFAEISQEQSKVIELINGMQEIKLHNAEKQKRWQWEHIQARLFGVSIKNLALEQYQSVGSSLINELKNIIITVISAKLVIEGSITLGMMLAISYIVGQLNSPIQQFINFVRQIQDAKISLERLGEIHNMRDEDSDDMSRNHVVNANLGFELNDVSFRYTGSHDNVLENLAIGIPANKTTAIVGSSGSGKTTLMKMLLKFYKPTEGKIRIGDYDLSKLSNSTWRSQCGVVMQEGYVFNDTIAANIAIGEDNFDIEKLDHAANLANIYEFIHSLPLGYNTKIGMEGQGLSTGQKQRLFIARAIYKNPDFLFFDEATSALDAENEKIIMQNLNLFFEGKTVVVIAHRLSTVKNADQILVLDKGKIIEKGSHIELVAKKGSYFNLVKNQLELGN